MNSLEQIILPKEPMKDGQHGHLFPENDDVIAAVKKSIVPIKADFYEFRL